MITVEIECIRQKKRNSVLIGAYTLYSKDIEGIDFLRPTRILVFGAVDNTGGKVIIAGKVNNINVFRYEGEEDMDGKEMNVKRPIEVSGSQELSISRKRGKVIEEVTVFIDAGENDEKLDFNPTLKTPVGVS